MTIQEAISHLTPASVSNLKLGNCFCTFGTKTIVFCFKGKLYVVPYSELLESFLFQNLKYSVDLQNQVKEFETTLRQSDDRELMKLLTTEKCKEISRKMGIQPISQKILDNAIKIPTTGGFVSISPDGAVWNYSAARDKYDLKKMVAIFLGEFNFRNNVITFITNEGKQYFTKYEGEEFIQYLKSLGYKRNEDIGVPCSNGDYPAEFNDYQKSLKDKWDAIVNSGTLVQIC